jgi:hypothetical protein
MRRAIITAMLTLAGCSSERVQPIGLHQYQVTGEWRQVRDKPTETCAKLGRQWIRLGMPPGSPPDEIRFECVNSYEIVPAGADTYTIRVLSQDMQLADLTVPATKDMPATTARFPNVEPADREATQRGTEYCAKMGRAMKITGGGFDAGPGLEIIFKCVPQGSGAP